MATGDIVGIINSDDFNHRCDVIAQVAETFQDKTIQAIYGDVRFVNPDNLDRTVRYYSSKRFVPILVSIWLYCLLIQLFLLIRKYFDQFGYYKTNYKIAADYELLVRFFICTPVKE